MRTCWKTSGMLLLLAGLANGCAIHHVRPSSDQCGHSPVQLECRPTLRKPLTPDLSNVAEVATNFLPIPQREYCELTEQDTIFIAATHSPIAQMLNQEADALQAQSDCRLPRHRVSGCVFEILRLHADHERNRSASLAAQTLFRLAEAEAGSANLRERFDVLAAMSTDINNLQQAGVASPLTLAEIELQILDLQHKQLDVETTIDQLNRQLANQLGMELTDHKRVWPDIDLRVDHQPQTEEEAIGRAAFQRCDLRALRCALELDETNDLPALRTLVGAAHPAVGLALESSWRPLHLCTVDTGELSIRHNQIAALISQQELALNRDIANAITEVEIRYQQVAISRQKLRVQQTRLDRHRDAVAGANSNVFEGRQLQLERLGFEQDVIHDVIEWKVAVIRLLELEGQLWLGSGA